MQKWAVFHLISKHSLNINFLCFFLWIIKINKPKVNLNILFPKRHTLHFFFIAASVDEQINKPKSTSMFISQNVFAFHFLNSFFFQHFRDAPPLNTVSGLLDLSLFWLLLVTGSLILFVWTLGNKLLVIFHTQVNLFSIAGPVYRLIIEPYFSYCSLVWDSLGQTQSKKL